MMSCLATSILPHESGRTVRYYSVLRVDTSVSSVYCFANVYLETVVCTYVLVNVPSHLEE